MNNIDILEEGIKKMIQDERIHDDYRDMITAISNLILDNYILKSKVEELLKEIENRNYNDYTDCQDGNEVKYNILLELRSLLEKE